jgi:hypothetical protein
MLTEKLLAREENLSDLGAEHAVHWHHFFDDVSNSEMDHSN